MTELVMVLTALTFTLRARSWLRQEYRPYVERRVQERARGLRRGALIDRWATDGNGMSDETWIRVLRHVNKATRAERRRLMRQRSTA